MVKAGPTRICLSTNQNDASSTTSSDWPQCTITITSRWQPRSILGLKHGVMIVAAQGFEEGYVSE
jgi:hypothetical protein